MTSLEKDASLAEALKRCASEAIHQPGSIQPHGMLVLVDGALTIRHVSANAGDFLDMRSHDLLGKPLADVLGVGLVSQLASMGAENGQTPASVGVTARIELSGGFRYFSGHAHRHDHFYWIELTPDETADYHTLFDSLFIPLRDRMWSLESTGDIDAYAQQLSDLVATMTGYDRVMVYRFDSQWDGEVIAESLTADVTSYLGNHFPASDIPPQARALYLKNRLRQIVDVDAAPVPVLPALNVVTGAPLDMSFATLRSFSPIHLEYLRNMSVHASLTISLVCNGRLWGLIACHHRSAKPLPVYMRELMDFVGRTASMKIEAFEREKTAAIHQQAQEAMVILGQGQGEPQQRFNSSESLRLLGLVGAIGAVVCINHRKYYLGRTPDIAFLNNLTNWLIGINPGHLYVTDGLAVEFPEAGECGGIANGLLVTPIDEEMKNYVMWFRPEIMQSIKWAGNPEKVLEDSADGFRISPRQSFASWVQSYGGHSAKWSYSDIEVAQNLSFALIRAVTEYQTGIVQGLPANRLLHDPHTLQAELTTDLRYQWVTSNSEGLLGYSAKELAGHPLTDFVFEEDIHSLTRYLIRVLAGESVDTIVFRHSRKNGSYSWLELRAKSGNAEHSDAAHLINLVARDVTERQEYNESLERLHRRHHRLLDIRREGVITLDSNHRVVQVNDAALSLLGHTAEGLVGTSFCKALCRMPQCEHKNNGLTRIHHAGEKMIDCWQGHLSHADGHDVPVTMWSVRLFSDRANAGEAMIFRLREDTGSEQANSVECLNLGVFVTDRNGTICAVNQGFNAITGYSTKEAVGKTPSILRSNVHSRDFYKQFWQALAKNKAWRGEIWNRRKNGEVYPQVSSVFVVNTEQDGQFYVAIFQDVSTTARLDEKSHAMPDHDPLTGLPGRFLFERTLAERVAQAGDRGFALAFLDMFNFKAINDALGHITGDRLLYLIAARLKRELRGQDMLARWGGDKFILLLTDVATEAEAALVMRRLLLVFNQSFAIAGKQVTPNASVGISLYPKHGVDVESLMNAADTALNHAKARGEASVEIFCEEFSAHSRQRFDIANDLRHALKEQQLFLVYQPQVSAGGSETIGLEALVRWKHPVRGIVPPGEFIQVAEETGLMVELGEEIFEMACMQVRAWLDAGITVVPVGINVSPLQIKPGFPDFVAALLKEYRVPPQLIEIEITESALKPTPEIRGIVKGLKDLGVSLAIDDFGTGYSSLSHLKLFPFDRLKIDKSFVDGLPSNEDDIAIGQAIIALGQALKVNVLAEGVEQREQADYLASEGVHAIQGYFYSKPLPVADATAYLLKGPEEA